MSWHISEALAAPVWDVFGLSNAGYVLADGGFSEHVEASEDAVIGEMETTVAVVTVLLGDLRLGTLLGDVSLLVTVVTFTVTASAL